MNRQRGMSSLLMVLLILALGSLTLQGMSRQQQARLSEAGLELMALKESASAESLLEWGRVYSWSSGPAVQCLPNKESLCLRAFSDGSALLMASSGQQSRWQTGEWLEDGLHFHDNGWRDFCPRKEVTECQLP